MGLNMVRFPFAAVPVNIQLQSLSGKGFSRSAGRDGDGDGRVGTGEGVGGEEGATHEGDTSARGGNRGARQPESLPGGVPESWQHLLSQERQISDHNRAEAT